MQQHTLKFFGKVTIKIPTFLIIPIIKPQNYYYMLPLTIEAYGAMEISWPQ
jgi:hypothetical protein